MPKISVIVPVYNVEPYLRQCVDSILNQTFTDFELLLVDDGSTDCSGAICDEYANRDFRVKVFYTVNRGVSAARNLGIDKASAEWVTFVDSDDFVESDYLESLDKGESCELSFVGISRYNIDNKSRQVLVKFHSEFIFREQLGKKVVELDLLAVGYACGKLYKKEIIDSNHIRFDERVRIHEDHLFYYDYLIYCQSIYLSDSICYNYTCQTNGTSLSHIVAPYRMLLTASDGFVSRYPTLFKHLGITDIAYVKRITTEYGISTRRAAVYSLYYYKENTYTRLSFFDEQSPIFLNLYRKYGYKPGFFKHWLLYMFLCMTWIPPQFKDWVLKGIYKM
ncbi:glycosyltransferase [Bacteroides sp. ET71]|uniref:glycosyltransferase family 2 protein n=1 Tax=Bacteroides sp. ET71 TaxID=2939421 RepID=UPI0020116F24|nr:glycosyltransferase family 2 protein [Bacteroides sp. ET71]MCL1614945.1 glycosyltransferase [Bacteroides sp. ET71]